MKTGVYRGKKIFDPTVQARSTTGEKNSNEKKQQKKESK